MPRPVCGPCGLEMTLTKIGVVVQFNIAHRPYQQWSGDAAQCPGCGTVVVARWGDGPTWVHHNDAGDIQKPDIIVPERNPRDTIKEP